METLCATAAMILMVATIIAKVGTTRLAEHGQVRMRSLERKRMDRQQRLSALIGERELLRREHIRASQDVRALKGQLRSARAELSDQETETERTNQRLARTIRSVDRQEAMLAQG
jgi:hypothetical protein